MKADLSAVIRAPSCAVSAARMFPVPLASELRPGPRRFRSLPTCFCENVNTRAYSSSQVTRQSASQHKDVDQKLRLPKAIQAVHLKPLKNDATFGIPSCDLQLRSFSTQPLEFFADFALRAAYYLGLSAYGPIPLPRITERWTVPKSHFIFKKAQENFERVTLRRMIQIKDGNPETVQLWLAYLRKHQMYGVGMKANVWEFGPSHAAASEKGTESQLEELESTWQHLGQTESLGTADRVEELLSSRRFKEAAGLRQPPDAKEQAPSTN